MGQLPLQLLQLIKYIFCPIWNLLCEYRNLKRIFSKKVLHNPLMGFSLFSNYHFQMEVSVMGFAEHFGHSHFYETLLQTTADISLDFFDMWTYQLTCFLFSLIIHLPSSALASQATAEATARNSIIIIRTIHCPSCKRKNRKWTHSPQQCSKTHFLLTKECLEVICFDPNTRKI